jgi:hypothetical protein
VGQKINIPSQNQPFRKQSSLGGDVSFRNLNGTNDNSFITLAKVTKVYYKQGKLDFKLTNTVSIVQEQGGDGSGSAPIPVDFFGRKPDGQVFGHYRPVKVGDLIAIAYINGHRSNQIVIGVYPDSAPDYELISPSMFETGDDNDSGIAETGLAEQKVYPSMQTSYRSGSGTIAEALNGHSFLILDDETANQYDQLWTDYESVGFFNHNGETTNPLKEEAGSWLLVHEDNPDGDGDGHRTRFYVNPKGEIQIVLMGSDSEGDVSVLEGSRKDGFTLKHYNDLSSIKAGDKGQDVYNPDFDVAKKYVELNIGKDQSILMQAVDQGFSGGNTNLTVKPDGVYLNDKPLNASITDSVREHSKEVADAISKDLTSTKEWEDFDKRVTQAGKDAKDAGDKAKQAGEDAKQAGISAEKAGEDAKKTGEDIKRHVIYYASAFPQGDHYIPGKYLAINTETYIANGIIKSAMIEDGAIDNAKIAYEAVGSSQIEDLAVTRGKLAYMAVGTAQIEDLAVSDEKVDHLSFNHMEGELLDAHKIRVRNLSGDSISAKTLTADKLIIGELGDITDKLGTIADGNIIVKGNGKDSGVTLDGLDADNPDVYTPSKKAILVNIVRAIKSSAEASLDYAKEVGLNNDPIAKDLQKKYDAMVDGLAPIFNDMTATTNFDHNTVEQLTSDCNNAIDKFQNLANSQLNRKIGQTADNKNSVYQGYEQPANPHINDIWFQENSDGTYQIRVYDGGSWISPGMQDIKEVQESVSTLPRSYYSSIQPAGTDYKDGDIWYKTSTDTTNNTVVYTAYKWNRNTNTWDPLLDATSSHNYIGSAPANPINGDFWMDNTTLKQYQNGVWKTIPTQGPQGVPGVSAKQQYIHTAYATSADGNNNFSVDSFSGATYIGLLVDFDEEDSKDHTKYTWSLIKGKDGTDGKDGVPGKPGVDGKTSYVHFAYANSSDGNTDFNLEYFANALYVGTYTDFTESDSSDHTKYTWSRLRGDKGDQGIPGADGTDGKTYYTWIKYATDSSGSNISDSPTGMSYIGIAYNKGSQTESSTPTDYKWTKIKGDDGIPGTPGADGKTSYFHVAYANSSDGSIGFTTSPNISSSYRYLGTYTDYTSTSSRNPSSYTWAPMFDSTKKRNFTSQPTTPYAVGDTWTQSGATYFCTVARDSGAFRQDDWEMQQLTIHSLDSSVANSLHNDNLVSGTDQKYTMGYGIPNTVWQDDYAYLKLPTNATGYEILPQDPHTFFHVMNKGTTYTQTIWFETDATVKDLSRAQITWFTNVGHDPQPATLINLGENKYKLYSTYMWTGKSDNNVRLFDIFYLNFAFDLSTGTYLKFGKLKLEKGSVATPWCLSQSELTTTTRDYRGVTLNDRGLTATAGSTTVAMNSNDGFLINNASGQVFHVDTSGNLNMKGNITAGNISGVNFIGDNLTLNNSLQVINGNISADNGNVVINSNGLTIKDGGLKIVNSKGETTTEIRDDGTFATNKGFFSGSITGSNIVLNGNDGSKISASGGAFSVDGFGNVTANSIKITGNRKDDVSNQALIKGASITDGNIIKGNLIEGNNIIGNRIQSSEFMTSTREYSNGSYYPISGSIYTPSFLIEDSGNISVHTVFPQAFSTIARIGSNKGVDGPYVNITHEAFDRSTLSGSFGYGRGYEYPVPYLYGHQGGMVEYPVNSNELSIVYMNDISRSEYNGYGLYDGYKYTEIATINDIVQKYKSKIGRIKFNFGIVCTYGSYDTSGGTTTAGGYHDLYVVLTTGRINENDTYHVDFDGKTFNNVKNNIKIKMTSKKVLTGVGGLSYYNLYAELSTKDLDLANTYYLGVLQKGFIKDSRESLANHTWKIQIDEMAIIPEGDILDDQGYYVPTAGGSYRDLTISANGSIITHEDDIGVQTTSEYSSRYLSFAVSTDGQSPMPYWTTISADGIGFSIGNNNSSTDGSGNPNGLATRQCIYFSGDTNQNGMSMDNFGNIHAQVGAGVWRVYNNQGDEVFDVPFDPNGVFNFYVPRVNKNQDPGHKWGGLKIGWVYFDQAQYRWAETVPAIYNTGGRVKGFAMFDQYLISFVDGWCYQLASWWNHGVPNGVDSSKGEAQGTNTDAGHRGV